MSSPSTEINKSRPNPPPPVAVSACLLGIGCRYDGRSKFDPQLADHLAGREVLPLCPEELGGLSTPRPACAIRSGDGADVLDGRAQVTTAAGGDLTAAYVLGARKSLQIMRRRGITTFLAKARSPSCGCGCHSVFGRLRPGDGVTTALLRRHGVEVREV